MIDTAVILLVAYGRLPWAGLVVIIARDLLLLVGWRLLAPRGIDLEVNLVGKGATWLLYTAIGTRIVTHNATSWPLWLFWIGLGAAVVAAALYVRGGSERAAAVKAVVMAGGEGTRLRPLTSNQPKPMVPIVGKPCMEHILELLKLHGFEEVIVTVAFLPQAIRSYFGGGETLGMDVSYSVEETPLGTAGSVRLAAGRLDDTFLVISGDALCDVDLTRLIEFHREKHASVTIGLKSVDNPLEFGIVVTDDDGRIERFLEKPSWGQVFSDTINTGIYVVEPEVLRHIPKDRPYDFSKELFPLLLEMGRPMYGHVDGRLLAGHREPRPVPSGELRRARRACPAQCLRDPHPGQRLGRRGRRPARSRRDRRAGVPRQLLPRGARRDGGPVLGAPERASRCAKARARSIRSSMRRPRSGARRASRARSSAAPAISERTSACTRASRSATRSRSARRA